MDEEDKAKALKTWQIVALIVLAFILGGIPFLLDPYYHETKVTLFEWLKREIDELQHGEK